MSLDKEHRIISFISLFAHQWVRRHLDDKVLISRLSDLLCEIKNTVWQRQYERDKNREQSEK